MVYYSFPVVCASSVKFHFHIVELAPHWFSSQYNVFTYIYIMERERERETSVTWEHFERRSQLVANSEPETPTSDLAGAFGSLTYLHFLRYVGPISYPSELRVLRGKLLFCFAPDVSLLLLLFPLLYKVQILLTLEFCGHVRMCVEGEGQWYFICFSSCTWSGSTRPFDWSRTLP